MACRDMNGRQRVHVIIETVEAKPQANAGLEIQNPASDGSPVRVRVTNARDSGREKFQLAWQLASGMPAPGGTMEIYVPPGQTHTYSTPMLPAGTTTAELQLSGDEVDFDNRSYFAAPQAEHLTVAWFGPDSGNDPQNMRYYLQRVFPETSARQVKVISPVVQQTFSPDLLNQAAFAVIPGRMPPEEITPTHDWLARGKNALFVVTDGQSASGLTALTGLTGFNITEAAGDYALLGDIDFTHPVFAPFADPRFSDFTHIHFWKHRRLDIPSAAQGPGAGQVRRRRARTGANPGWSGKSSRAGGGLESSGQPVCAIQQISVADAGHAGLERRRRACTGSI